MQTAKINQGNTALKRVVESIANGDSHVPFRDSKLTMLLQVHFIRGGSSLLEFACLIFTDFCETTPIILFRILLRMINPKF